MHNIRIGCSYCKSTYRFITKIPITIGYVNHTFVVRFSFSRMSFDIARLPDSFKKLTKRKRVSTMTSRILNRIQYHPFSCRVKENGRPMSFGNCFFFLCFGIETRPLRKRVVARPKIDLKNIIIINNC